MKMLQIAAPSRLLQIAALAVAASGCAVPKKGGFHDVERLIAARTHAELRWRWDDGDGDAIERATRELLREPLTLESATRIALVNNPRLQATFERLGVAQADLVQAGLLRNPTIAGHVGFPIGTRIFEWEVSGALSLVDALLIPIRRKLARAEFERVKLEVADAVLQLQLEARQAFVSAQSAAQIVALRRIVLDAAEAQADLARAQERADTLSALDSQAAQADATQARLELLRAQATAESERERLARALGVWGRGAAFTIVERLPELPPRDPPLDHVETIAVERRLDLAAAQAEVRQIAASLAMAKGARFIGGLDAGVAAHQDADGPRTVGPTLALELPIFDQRQAAIARLRAELRAAERRADAIAIEARSQARSARTRLAVSRAAVEYYRSTVLPMRERIVALSQRHYDAMLLGVYQLLMAKQAEVNGYREYLEAVRDYWLARAELERAIAGDLEGVGQ